MIRRSTLLFDMEPQLLFVARAQEKGRPTCRSFPRKAGAETTRPLLLLDFVSTGGCSHYSLWFSFLSVVCRSGCYLNDGTRLRLRQRLPCRQPVLLFHKRSSRNHLDDGTCDRFRQRFPYRLRSQCFSRSSRRRSYLNNGTNYRLRQRLPNL